MRRISRLRRIFGVHLALRFHDLRRRCASTLLDDAKKSVARSMNWKCQSMVDLYANKS